MSSSMDFKQCGIQKRCPECGQMFGCDYERGTQCWCSSEFPTLAQKIQQERGCLCRACLAKKVAERVPSGNA